MNTKVYVLDTEILVEDGDTICKDALIAVGVRAEFDAVVTREGNVVTLTQYTDDTVCFITNGGTFRMPKERAVAELWCRGLGFEHVEYGITETEFNELCVKFEAEMEAGW